MKHSQMEFRVGLFVIVALALLATCVLFFGNKNLWTNDYPVTVHFGFTNGVEVGAPVRYSGVKIGDVRTIDIIDDGRTIALGLYIHDDVVLRNDVAVYVNTLGVMGEKYIEFIGGSVSAPVIGKEGIVLTGVDPIAMNDLSKVAQDIAREVNETFQGLKSVLGDAETQENLKQSIENMRLVTENLNHLLTEIKNGHGFLGQMMTDEDMYHDMKDLVADVKAHPWKLLIKTKANREKKMSKSENDKNIKKKSKTSIYSRRR